MQDDGVIFISIDDNEVYNLKKLCDEVFGEDNFAECVALFVNDNVPSKGLTYITVEIAEQMAEYAPGLIVFSDKCFEDTTALANVDLALRDIGIDIQII